MSDNEVEDGRLVRKPQEQGKCVECVWLKTFPHGGRGWCEHGEEPNKDIAWFHGCDNQLTWSALKEWLAKQQKTIREQREHIDMMRNEHGEEPELRDLAPMTQAPPDPMQGDEIPRANVGNRFILDNTT